MSTIVSSASCARVSERGGAQRVRERVDARGQVRLVSGRRANASAVAAAAQRPSAHLELGRNPLGAHRIDDHRLARRAVGVVGAVVTLQRARQCARRVAQRALHPAGCGIVKSRRRRRRRRRLCASRGARRWRLGRR
eukprot:4059088-Prymnesium_polylepis.1